MKQCEICNEFSARAGFSSDIRMTICDECLKEFDEFIENIDSLIEIEEC